MAFPIFSQHQEQGTNGSWRNNRRPRDFDTQSIQTNDAYPRYGHAKFQPKSNAYYDCIRNIQVHVETTLNRFHDLYERKVRPSEAERLSEDSIEKLIHQYDEDRVAAALHLLAETYKRIDLPQADEARRTLLDWWDYLLCHRHPNRTVNKEEEDYEHNKAQAVKEAATKLWKQYNLLIEDGNRWLDTYMAEVSAREKEAHMNMRIQALNARDKEFGLESTQNINPNSLWFDNKRSIPTRRRPVVASRSISDHQKVDYDNMGHHEAREADKKAIKETFENYRPVTQVMGSTSEDHQKTEAIIDTGDDGPNVVSLQFLKRLKLDGSIESNWHGAEPNMWDASGKPLRTEGWVELYFKFEKLPGGWHTDYFLVSDVPHYDLIIGMPCLLQDKIKNKLIAPLIINKPQKKQSKATSQRAQDPQYQDRLARSENRREQKRQDKVNGESSDQGNSNTGSRTTTNAFLGRGNYSDRPLTAVTEEMGGFFGPGTLSDIRFQPFQEGQFSESWAAKTPEPFDWAENVSDNSQGSQLTPELGESDPGPGPGSGKETTLNGRTGDPDERKKQDLPQSSRKAPRFFAMDNDPQKAWTLVTSSKRSRKVKQAEQTRRVEKENGEKRGG